MKKVLLLAILVVVCVPFQKVHSQEFCGSHEHLLHQLANNPDMARRLQQLEQFTEGYVRDFDHAKKKTTSVLHTIPVVFHVLYNNSYTNISDAQIQSQVDALNRDFQQLNPTLGSVPAPFQPLVADCQIAFCLATRDPDGNITNGIVRKSTTKASFDANSNDAKFNATGGADAWPRDRYLNIWVVPNLTCCVAAYAQFPGGPAATDGIVAIHAFVGTTGTAQSPQDKGQIIAHEVGHWVNLRHIWGDDGSSCNGSDLVGDTPNQGGANGGCPTFPKPSCTNGPNKQGPEGDMFMNFMDYSNCTNMFSLGQKARIYAVLAPGQPRYEIVSSPACTPIPTSCGAPEFLTAKDISSSGALLKWFSVPQAVDYTVSWKVAGSAGWLGSAPASGNSYLLSGLSASTNYEYEVSVNCQDLNTYSSGGLFTTLQNCTDVYEPNNSANTAPQISINTDVLARIATSSDVDYFKFTNTAGTPRFKVSLTNLPANYNLYVYKPNKNSLAGSSVNGGTADETVTYNTTTIGTYYALVVGSGGASSSECYNLKVELSASNFFEQEEFTINESDQILLYPNPAQNEVKFNYFAHSEGVANLIIIDQTGRITRSLSIHLQQGENNPVLDIREIPTGLYYVKLATAAGAVVTKLSIQR